MMQVFRMQQGPADAVSSADGRFEVPDLSPGEQVGLHAELSGYVAGSVDGVRAPDLVEVATDPVAGVVLRMARGQAVVGRLLGAGPDDLASAQVMARSRSGTAMGEVDFEGGYRIPGMAPGSWSVQAMLGTWSGRAEVSGTGRIEVRLE